MFSSWQKNTKNLTNSSAKLDDIIIDDKFKKNILHTKAAFYGAMAFPYLYISVGLYTKGDYGLSIMQGAIGVGILAYYRIFKYKTSEGK